MRAKRLACFLLLLSMVVVSGCQRKKDLVGRWDMGGSNFYFRQDGVVFYLSSSKVRYQGRYSYDGSTEPGTVRADLQEMNGDRRRLTLNLLVTFLTADRVRFEDANGSSYRSMVAARVDEDLGQTDSR
jgi:hypothetical protein